MRKFIKGCNCEDIDAYARKVLRDKDFRTDKEIKQLCRYVKNEFNKGNIEVDLEQYQKYIKIGFLFFNEIFDWQRFATAVALCTYYKKTRKARWNKTLVLVGRGNGKDGMIAWWSVCLTSVYHGIRNYDVDIIANNMTQSLRPLLDIKEMIERKNKKNLLEKVGDSIISYKTNSNINARSSDATQQDGLRSGAVIFNEIHIFPDYKKINVMITGLGKIDDPRTFYFTTNGEVRGGPLDDLLDSAKDILSGETEDKGKLFLIYKLDNRKQVHDKKNWMMANPSLPYRDTLMSQLEDEYEIWARNPNQLPAFMQKRMNLPEMPTDQEVVPWEVIKKTNQKYDYKKLKGNPCIVGIDLSKTTDWTSVNFLFYDYEIEKFICFNHSFICAQNKDLQGIKAPVQEWCEQGYGTIIDEKEIDPDFVCEWIMRISNEKDFDVQHIVIDDFKKGIMLRSLEKIGFTLADKNLSIIRPSNIATVVPVIERAFINEKLIWGENVMLRWATNNTKVVPWKPTKTTGDNDMGNQLYGKINPRFRKTDPFMAFVHSFTKYDLLIDLSEVNEYEFIRGF